MVLVQRLEWELLGIKWNEAYYVDTCLPFGLRSTPYHFNQFAEAMQWILQHNYGLIHYLDDYLIVGTHDSHSCGEHLQCFLWVCNPLGISVTMDKVEGPATVFSFLGLELVSPTTWQIKRNLCWTDHPTANNQPETALSDCICSTSGPSRQVSHTVAKQQTTSQYTPQQWCSGRHRLVAKIFANVEWHSTVCWPTAHRCSRPRAIHRCV